jgi:apolipoprotein N-acyltransferase
MTDINNVSSNNPEVDVLPLISRKRRLLEMVILLLSGAFMTLSLPGYNWSLIAWVAMVPLFMIIPGKSMFAACRGGFWWGLGWGLPSFYWLREIDPVVPFLMAPVLSIFIACWASLVPIVWRYLLLPAEVRRRGYVAIRDYDWKSPWREFFVALIIAGLWCIAAEWSRSMMFPWNYLSASQWRNLSLIQICEYTGTYGISFLIVLFNITLAMTIECFRRGAISFKKPRRAPLLPTLALLVIVLLLNYMSTTIWMRRLEKTPKRTLLAGIVQGDISQRRNATFDLAKEALDVYISLSKQLVLDKPDVVIWPECAVPIPFRSGGMFGEIFRKELSQVIAESQIPFLIGTIDYTPGRNPATGEYGVLNSAMMITPAGGIVDTFDKIQRVPFGEYVPFRSILPEWLVKRIDMDRDLTPGTDFSPIELKPGFRAGISVCFEDVFPYIARREAQLGANMLLVITNDAWYPTSDEPEQHLANSVFRAIETRLPFLRSGNNSASCLVSPAGVITKCLLQKTASDGQKIPAPELRGRAYGVIEVEVPVKPIATFYTKYGDMFILFCWVLTAIGLYGIIRAWLADRESLSKCVETDASEQGDFDA